MFRFHQYQCLLSNHQEACSFLQILCRNSVDGLCAQSGIHLSDPEMIECHEYGTGCVDMIFQGENESFRLLCLLSSSRQDYTPNGNLIPYAVMKNTSPESKSNSSAHPSSTHYLNVKHVIIMHKILV